jgi:glycosyltransferase involved in cell wall biosynthesis
MVKNEGHRIRTLFENTKKLVKEIVVVDTGSTDNTLEICNEYKAKIISHPCEPYIDMYRFCKQLALDNVSNDWALNLDADEIMSPELETDIRQFVRQSEFNCLQIRRINFFKNRQFNVDSVVRLVATKAGYKWVRNKCFELIIPHKEKLKCVLSPIYHFGWYDATEEQIEYKKKMYGEEFNYFLR